MNSAPGGQYSLENSAWGTVFTSENCLEGHFLGGGAKFPMTRPAPVGRAFGLKYQLADLATADDFQG